MLAFKTNLLQREAVLKVRVTLALTLNPLTLDPLKLNPSTLNPLTLNP